MTKIKVCGNTRREDVALALELGVELLGFIFTRSPRHVGIDDARRLTADIPGNVERVGVFIDEPSDEIATAIERCGLTAVQLYRPITEEDRRLGVPLLPALRMRDGASLNEDGFHATDHPLLDTFRPDTDGGGSGQTWEWSVAEALARRYPIVVSGGLTAGNVGTAIARLRPWGVDVCSGVEAEPGTKDPDKLRAFVEAVRRADQR
ncbi:MAG TPA: phosphoribosylanthranilate isomerase [Candidatus Dormibacteraeota bacterium]